MYTLKIVRDENPESPREYGTLGTMVCWHSRYNLGDEQPRQQPHDFIEDLPRGSVILPLFLYDHSGISMSTGAFPCLWDSGQVGYIYATPDDIRSEFGELSAETKAKTQEILEQEVKVYDQYLRGNVWGYELWKRCGSCQQDTDVEDSCWGFIGDDLAETGIEFHLADDIKPLLEQAWENRS